jgi:hypothetical protein
VAHAGVRNEASAKTIGVVGANKGGSVAVGEATLRKADLGERSIDGEGAPRRAQKFRRKRPKSCRFGFRNISASVVSLKSAQKMIGADVVRLLSKKPTVGNATKRWKTVHSNDGDFDLKNEKIQHYSICNAGTAVAIDGRLDREDDDCCASRERRSLNRNCCYRFLSFNFINCHFVAYNIECVSTFCQNQFFAPQKVIAKRFLMRKPHFLNGVL